jgi:pyruvate-formate lyase-activating enzyme
MTAKKTVVARVAETVRIPPSVLTDRPPFPRKAKIELTARCDLKCYFCSLTYKSRSRGDMDRELLERLLEELRALGVEDLGLFWLGEPMLADDLAEVVTRAKAMGFPHVFITTNGRLADAARMRELMTSGIDSVKFSLNASTRERYAKACGVDAFDRVIANIRSAWQSRGPVRRPTLTASTVCHGEDSGERDGVRALIGGYVDEHYVLPIYGNRFQGASRSLESMLPCWSLFAEAHISWDGKLSACFCDHDPQYFMGNLAGQSLAEAWLSPAFVALRQRHLTGDVRETVCGTCIAYNQGGVTPDPPAGGVAG